MKFFGEHKRSVLFFGFLAIVSIFVIGYLSEKPTDEPSPVGLSHFHKLCEGKNIESVKMEPEGLIAKLKDGKSIKTSYPLLYSGRIIDNLLRNNVEISFTPQGSVNGAKRVAMIMLEILSWLPMIIMIWLAFGFTRGIGGAGKEKSGGLFGSPFQFGKSKARLVKDVRVTFDDVAGIDEAKNDVAQIVDFLKNPNKYKKIGGKIPKGCLLIGPPGTGKTLLARAIAGEAKVPFWFISGSDFVEMFVGVGASRVRDVFAQAKKTSPSLLFIDEIDAVGRQRGIGLGGGNDEREQTLNQMLVEMDGFEENSGVIVIAATNRSDVLDPALLRPGRFDRQISVSLPDVRGREQILAVHTKAIKQSPAVDLSVIARGTPGFSGAELANLINEAALLAASHNKEVVTREDYEEAKDKILLGGVRGTIMKQSEKELTAYHEGGHALVACHIKESDPVHKATIIPRANTLGVVVRLPEADSVSRSKAKTLADIAVAMAGRVAEAIVFGDDKITSGASSDIEMATRLARAMVTEWGMSDKVGMVCHSSGSGGAYSRYGESKHTTSTSVAEIIDKEVKRIIDECYERAKDILTTNRSDLDLIAKSLLEVETLTGSELRDLLKTKRLNRLEKKDLLGKSILGGHVNNPVNG